MRFNCTAEAVKSSKFSWFRLGSALLLLVLGSCTEPKNSQIRVSIDADIAVRPLIDEVIAVVETGSFGSTGWKDAKPTRFTTGPRDRWPIEFSLPAHSAGEGSAFQLTATARDKRQAVVAQARAVRAFGDEDTLTLRVLFEVSCVRLNEQCASSETCHHGACVDSKYDGRKLVPSNESLPTATPMMPDGPRALEGDGCPTEGARSCAPAPVQVPLVCTSSSWQAQPQCLDSEMCDPATGMCRKIAPECEKRELLVEFCEQSMMRVCTSKFSSMPRPCDENALCVTTGANAACTCRTGFTKDDGGQCREARDCSVAAGGCDPLTQCSMQGGKRACSACPDGFVGTGETGCEPLLAGLKTSAGQLQPAFAQDVMQYALTLPLLVQRITLTPSAAATARIVINGEELSTGGSWTSPTLPYGNYTVTLGLTTSSGANRTYTIDVKRGGSQSTYLKASNTGYGDSLGVSIAADGDTLVAGAAFEDGAAKEVNGERMNNGAEDSGAAYVFVRRGDVWEEQAYLKPMDTTPGDFFGSSVAISGDTIVVGAIRDNPLSLGLLSSPTRGGVAYVFTRTQGVWKQTDRLAPTGGEVGDRFGFTSAIDGDTIAIGAPHDGASGSAHVFARNGDKWVSQGELKSTKVSASSAFGSAVAVSGDTLIVGASEDDAPGMGVGSATVFERSGETWSEKQYLAPSPAMPKVSFGFTMAMNRDTLMVGAPVLESLLSFNETSPGQVFVFERKAGMWAQTQVLTAMVARSSDSFGTSVALTSDAALIGACGDRSGGRGLGADASRRDAAYSGAAYLFAHDAQGWTSSTYLKAANANTNDMFGFGAALTSNSAIVSGIWESSNAVGIDGDASDNSLLNAGALYEFR